MDTLTPNPDNIDVHGNQYGLLRSSKCFKMSQTMICTTCHNPHENERGNIALFSSRCIACHGDGHEKICKLTDSIGPSIAGNCIDCHMPLKASHSITELLSGDKSPTAALIRSHLIKIYPEATIPRKTGLTKKPLKTWHGQDKSQKKLPILVHLIFHQLQSSGEDVCTASLFQNQYWLCQQTGKKEFV